ncbi:hypothetical protein DY000_02054263 [Brassica cretica]|uniref:Uncharacterized protein n=1 Tax=Brassica cretica TaxID=69181 RepID=A0ABQ7AHW7_BRACR|nr:hypothetical protein DY000_02054263 [Brassica cretica]
MVDTVEALIEQLIDRASGWAQLGYWHIDSAESLAIYLKNGKRLLEASKGEIGERERSVLVDLACEMLKSARKIAGKHLDALKHCEISVAMSKELIKKMKTVDEYFGSEEA